MCSLIPIKFLSVSSGSVPLVDYFIALSLKGDRMGLFEMELENGWGEK